MAVSQTDGAACLAQWGNGGSVLPSTGRPCVNTRKMEVQRTVVVKTRLAVWNAVARAQDEVTSELARHNRAAGSAQPNKTITRSRIPGDKLPRRSIAPQDTR